MSANQRPPKFSGLSTFAKKCFLACPYKRPLYKDKMNLQEKKLRNISCKDQLTLTNLQKKTRSTHRPISHVFVNIVLTYRSIFFHELKVLKDHKWTKISAGLKKSIYLRVWVFPIFDYFDLALEQERRPQLPVVL